MPVESLVEGSVVQPDLSVHETYDVVYQMPNNGPVYSFSVAKVDEFYPLILAEVERLSAQNSQVFSIP